MSFIGPQPPLASLVLFCLLPLAFWAFSNKRPAAAGIIVVLFTALFAPEHAYFKFPSLPAFNKMNLAYFSCFLAIMVNCSKNLFQSKPLVGPELLAFIAAFFCLATATTNPDSLTYGDWRVTTLPGLTLKDGQFMMATDLFGVVLPFIVGKAVFKSSKDLEDMLRIWLKFGLVYTLFALWEIRFSPQMHMNVYGYRAHEDFLQTMRWGGWRPQVFMQHGLALSVMMLHFLNISGVFTRLGIPIRKGVKPKWVTIYLAVVLVLCKSTGAIVYALVALPLVLKGSVKAQLRAVMIMALLAMFYPAVRTYELVDVKAIGESFHKINPERAESLIFRFTNEEIVLDKARERLWFGWGEYGRNLCYDDEQGRMISVTDGQWIIVFGIRGLIGFIGEFGMLGLTLLYAWRKVPLVPDPKQQLMLSTFALMLAFGVFDLIPNGLFHSYPLFLAGALFGLVRGMTSAKAIKAAREQMRTGGVKAPAPQQVPPGWVPYPQPWPGVPMPQPVPGMPVAPGAPWPTQGPGWAQGWPPGPWPPGSKPRGS